MRPVAQTLTAVTDASGDATVRTRPYEGRVIAIIYTKTDYAAGVDFTVTSETTGQAIWTATDQNASVTVAPRQQINQANGTGAAYAASGEPVLDYFRLANEPVKIVVAQGGNAKTGDFTVIVELGGEA